jgi:hypothetical protein
MIVDIVIGPIMFSNFVETMLTSPHDSNATRVVEPGLESEEEKRDWKIVKLVE